MSKQEVNKIILASIPINKDLKKYFLKKFDRMVENNGQAYACSRFSDLRNSLCGYRSDRNRKAHADAWLRKSGFKVNGWLRMLYSYMDTQPNFALQFVKLYCGPNDPIVSVGSAAESQHRVLNETLEVNSSVPLFMERWLHHIGREHAISKDMYNILKRLMVGNPNRMTSRYDWMRNYIRNHSYEDYRAYVYKWKHLLYVKKIPDCEIFSEMGSYIPRAEMYSDYGSKSTARENYYSESFEEDVKNLLAMAENLGDDLSFGENGLSHSNYDFILSCLPPELTSSLFDEGDLLKGVKRDFLDGTYVGQIHHIPKKGTVKRRSIAAPNRFVQLGMVPADYQLSIVLRNLQKVRDCTYNQAAQDKYIVNRVSNDNLYCGSVDLHQATDFLPFNWMISIWNNLFEGRVSEMVAQSWDLFKSASKGAWLNEGYRDSWPVGQPLGAKPSFRCLGLTHNILLESLCFVLGIGHSPYTVLGDDVVIMNKKVRTSYIRLMTNAGIPLSLHKSYEGSGVEFAGKWFFKNQAPFYNTDQRQITWNSLFDYQFATGIYIPYPKLPMKLRRKFEKVCLRNGVPKSRSESVYRLIEKSMMPPRGPNVSLDRVQCSNSDIAEFIIQLDSEQDGILFDQHSGITLFHDNHPVSFGNRLFADKDGYFQPYRKVDSWYRDKYRPFATDKYIAVASLVIMKQH